MLGVGLERPGENSVGSLQPNIAGCAMATCRVPKDSGNAKRRVHKWCSVKKVILTLFSSAFSDFFTPHTLQVSLGKGVEPKCPRKAANCEQLKRAGATPEISG